MNMLLIISISMQGYFQTFLLIIDLREKDKMNKHVEEFLTKILENII
jgi:hypothetical protein